MKWPERNGMAAAKDKYILFCARFAFVVIADQQQTKHPSIQISCYTEENIFCYSLLNAPVWAGAILLDHFIPANHN